MATRDERLAAFEAAIAETEDLQRKGKKMPYTSLNGNMIAFVGLDDVLALRLSKAERAAFLEAHPDAVVTSYGSVMKDYVGVPDAILNDEEAFAGLWRQCVDNARTLKPKKTTR